MKEPKCYIDSASVKVMRSHDYCHFEVSLTASDDGHGCTVEIADIDDLRKTAARLVDKAVEQYKTAKINIGEMENDRYLNEERRRELKRADATPEGERSPRQKALIKRRDDIAFQRRRFDYEDDWDEPERPDFYSDMDPDDDIPL